MSEMVERVARAIMDADGDPKGCKVLDYQRERARAAIEAMREPTEEMIDALPKVGLLPVSEQRDYVIRDWRKMIDAALATEPAA